MSGHFNTDTRTPATSDPSVKRTRYSTRTALNSNSGNLEIARAVNKALLFEVKSAWGRCRGQVKCPLFSMTMQMS